MSAEVHKEQLEGEEPSESEDGGTLSILPSRKKLLLGGAVVVAAVAAYKVLTGGDEEDEIENESTEIDVDSSTLGEELRKLDEDVSDSDESDVEVSDEEDRSFEEKQEAAAEELHEDTPEYGGGE